MGRRATRGAGFKSATANGYDGEYLPSSSFCARENPELAAVPRLPGGALKLSSEGNWKGSDTGTRPPIKPKPRGRAGGLPTRPPPPATDDTWGGGGGHFDLRR